MVNQKLMQKLSKQQLKLKDTYKPPNVLSDAFQQQYDFIKDPAKRKVAICTRRAGKSHSVGLYLIDECLKTKCNCLYVARTKEAAENIMWNDIIDVIVKKYNIAAKPGISKLTLKFDNGSTLYLVGADANEKQMRALVGKKYNLICIDECQSFTNDLSMLVNKVLMPTIGDTNATICLIGTVGNDMSDFNFWYGVSNGKEPGWSVHKWHWRDNLIIRDNIQKQVDDLINSNHLIEKTDWFQQEYEGRWIPLTDSRIYKSQKTNYIKSLPENLLRSGVVYNLGMDFGFVDATTFVVTAYNNNVDNCLYVLESSRNPQLTVTAVANMAKEYMKKYSFNYMVCDAGAQAKQIVEEIRKIHSIPLIAADKYGKESHIAVINSDFITQNVLILEDKNKDLIHELETLIRDQKAMERGIWKEDSRKQNDICDALLYNHHYSRHFWYKPKSKPLTTDETIRKVILEKYCPTVNELTLQEDAYWESLND